MKYSAKIGLEVHVQLKTASKMFCGCCTEFGAPPNTHVCPVCLGYPGAMPTMNEEAIRLTVLSGLMIGSEIGRFCTFDRKSYFYPDMPKNYQITQYDKPFCIGGAVNIEADGKPKTIRMRRIHLEEDVAKNMHFSETSGVDFNRAGIPLMEIVTEPDLANPDETMAFLLAMKQIVQYTGASDCNLEQGNMRCDVNCSVAPEGATELGTKTEIKNMNTFKGVFNALSYEIARQVEVLESGGTIVQETRRWDVDAGVTSSMRSKEDDHDYRYFPEPDLMPVTLSDEQVDTLRGTLPELPAARRARFISQYGLPEYDAGVLVADRAVADYFEAVTSLGAGAKAVSNWLMTEMLRLCSERDMDIGSVAVTPQALADLIGLVDAGTVNSTTAKELFGELFDNGGDPEEMVDQRGLAQVSDTGEIEAFVEQAMADNPKSVEDYRAGKKAAAKFLVGQVMRLSRGKANPQMVMELLEKKLNP